MTALKLLATLVLLVAPLACASTTERAKTGLKQAKDGLETAEDDAEKNVDYAKEDVKDEVDDKEV